MMNNKEKTNQDSKIYQLYLDGQSYEQIAASIGFEVEMIKKMVVKERRSRKIKRSY